MSLLALVPLAQELIGLAFPDPAKKAEQLLKLKQLEQKGDLAELEAFIVGLRGQLEINKEEAKHPSVFVAGWRPAVGWVGALSLGYAGFVQPILAFFATLAGFDQDLPVVDLAAIVPILTGMLGIGVMRSHDKKHGVDTSRATK